MSLLSDIKNLLQKYLKNPVLVIAGAYILWKFINKQKGKNKESWLSERIQILDDEDKNDYSIIYDERTKKFVLIYKDRVFSSDNKEDLMRMVK